ncbi:MAG: peroxiredoxin family protein [Sphingomonadales bacterium]
MLLTRLKIFVLATLGALALAAPSVADDAMSPTDRGPAVGETLSFAADMTGADGKTYTLADLHGPQGTVLIFNRSLSWCPYCKAQTQDFIDHADAITKSGYSIAVITYDAPEALAKYAAETSAPFKLLSDPESQTIIALGLLNEKYEPGSFAYGIPHPIVIAVNTDGSVAAKFAEEGYKTRPLAVDVAEALSASASR